MLLLIVFFLSVIYLENNRTLAYTQTYLESYFKCDSKTGWKYSTQSKHMGKKQTTYRMGSEADKALYMSYVTNGASLWGSYADVTYSNSSMGYIYSFYDSSKKATATTSTNAGSDGITTDWIIAINSYYFDGNSTNGKNRTMAHELVQNVDIVVNDICE